MTRGKSTDESTLTSSSPKRRKFKLFSRSGKKLKPSYTSNTPVADLSPPVEISVSEEEKLSSDGKAKPRQLFPNQFKHDPSLKLKSTKKSFLVKSKQFQKLVDWAFKSIDIDKSGRVDKKELYSGLVLIHLKLAAYLGPAACRPATREYVEEIFDALDEDESGELDKEEFSKVITMLVSQMTTRVILQLSMTLVIVPMIAGYVFNCICIGYQYVQYIISNMDQFDKISSTISIMMEENIYSRMPDAVVAASAIIKAKVDSILTKEMLETLPITIIGVLLGMLLVPWAFLKCDAFFEKLNSIQREKKTT